MTGIATAANCQNQNPQDQRICRIGPLEADAGDGDEYAAYGGENAPQTR